MNTEEFEGFAPVYPALFNDWNTFIRKYWTLTLWPVKPCSPGLPGSPLAPCQEIKQEDEPLSDDRQPVPRVIESNKAWFMPALKKTTEVQFEDGETSFARSYVLANREFFFFHSQHQPALKSFRKFSFTLPRSDVRKTAAFDFWLVGLVPTQMLVGLWWLCGQTTTTKCGLFCETQWQIAQKWCTA